MKNKERKENGKKSSIEELGKIQNTEGNRRDGGSRTGLDNFDTLTFRKSSHAPNKFFQKLRFLRIKNRLSEILTLKFWRM